MVGPAGLAEKQQTIPKELNYQTWMTQPETITDLL